jgi:hypothetical protein
MDILATTDRRYFVGAILNLLNNYASLICGQVYGVNITCEYSPDLAGSLAPTVKAVGP